MLYHITLVLREFQRPRIEYHAHPSVVLIYYIGYVGGVFGIGDIIYDFALPCLALAADNAHSLSAEFCLFSTFPCSQRFHEKFCAEVGFPFCQEAVHKVNTARPECRPQKAEKSVCQFFVLLLDYLDFCRLVELAHHIEIYDRYRNCFHFVKQCVVGRLFHVHKSLKYLNILFGKSLFHQQFCQF